ncbi:gelsolin, cytoplasmic-like [Ylistrum balloti]|uniref:gelsolin, cytoplasmic-like n=1 Tax=Ylistrum balloti TaxID=509963 RepID=UPI002905BEF5|nr:gelsolin, cytoplasmic-like [Ylistrum balloti]
MDDRTVDDAFRSAGQVPGLEIWRIEKLKVVLQEGTTHGEFYSGDSYILLKTNKNAKSDKLDWDVHFWLGNETSQDEQGVAAYKTVELDDYLGGAPVQHREVQDHESKLFLSYFKHGIKYLSGGVESGFKKVERGVYEKRLFHIKGKRNVRVRQVRCDSSSLNQGDVFLLDCGMTLHLWNGPSSSHFERLKGSEVAKRIRDDERSGKAEIRIIDRFWDIDAKFFDALGSHGEIAEEALGGDDTAYERSSQEKTTLYRVSDSSGELEVKEVAKKPLSQSDLDSNDCFILDTGASGIYVWIGKHCSQNEKKSAWKHATDFLSLKGYPEWTKVTRLADGGETPVFKEYFRSWRDRDDQMGLGNTYTKENIAKINTGSDKIDFKDLQRPRSGRDEIVPPVVSPYTDESIKKWRVETTEMTLIEPEEVSVFSSKSCYVILHCYRDNLTQHHVVYFWQGSRSRSDVRAASAIVARRTDEMEAGGHALQVRVLEGKEPDMFLLLFTGQMLVFMFEYKTWSEITQRKRLFHIRGECRVNSRTIEVEPSSSSLNSQDTFLLINGKTTVIWKGKLSNSNEHTISQEMAGYIAPDNVIECVSEDEESEAFWEALGGKCDYAKFHPTAETQWYPPRLLHCSNTTGKFRVDEVFNFTQEDLCEDDVMLLDTHQEIFVWIGRGANRQEKKDGLQSAMDYLAADETERNEGNTLLLQLKQGYEPAMFTSHFQGWDSQRFTNTTEQMSQMDTEENSQCYTVQEELARYSATFRYEELVGRLPPVGVDPTCKEVYLSDAEFQKIFGLNRSVYKKMPRWKQMNLKKDVGLF